MTNILSEKDYQKYLLERLEQDNGFVIRKASNYDRLFAVDREMLFQFLNRLSAVVYQHQASGWRLQSGRQNQSLQLCTEKD